MSCDYCQTKYTIIITTNIIKSYHTCEIHTYYYIHLDNHTPDVGVYLIKGYMTLWTGKRPQTALYLNSLDNQGGTIITISKTRDDAVIDGRKITV